METPQIVWLRRDLRLSDHPAFFAAAEAGPVVPVYVLDDNAAGEHAYGGASRWWLHHSLQSLASQLGAHHSRIILRRGDAVEQLADISRELGGTPVHALRHYEPWWRKAQGALAQQVDLVLHDGNYLLPAGAVTTGSGSPYKIYTPFSKAVMEQMPPRDALPEPEHISHPHSWPKSDDLADWGLLPTTPDWAGGLQDFWQVGEAAAQDRLAEFEDDVAAYDEARNMPSIDGSSQLSPHLHFGEISPAQIWHALKGRRGAGWNTYAKELIWRDYAQNVICQFPAYATQSYRDGYGDRLWRNPNSDQQAAQDLHAWQRGQTGYPIVDAGMRQLWQTGWMHNRVRMITASFLVKHLLIDWTQGEKWFWDTLVDADYGSNGVNWQWTAGTGVDSNMFVRIMAPLSQSEKFGAARYIREFVPELAHLGDDDIHDPPAGMRPADYPDKIIGHKEARERALAAYREMKDG
ncbi:deoxyribodipyrimidine photo-lyase [Altererythrobacter confluentis]|uniref:Deoxyribodipyrimidine photo-lyase n=1 Tax=Allopontixanthobacter confluentis TaxID=1849021 RepID=A0A6L7GHW0_9SPHN|nr:deoxyribodipyrimidine photo-lyase [Allopontixanthobacter confluentis]MXP14291.1 deoxyribodipyrimidine photo-lyase [Allopontixanthobacter confluentis]